jgi:hypothetical protein
MRWAFRRLRREEAESLARAGQDLAGAKEELTEVRARWPEVRAKAEILNKHREQNGFAQLIREAMGVTR